MPQCKSNVTQFGEIERFSPTTCSEVWKVGTPSCQPLKRAMYQWEVQRKERLTQSSRDEWSLYFFWVRLAFESSVDLKTALIWKSSHTVLRTRSILRRTSKSLNSSIMLIRRGLGVNIAVWYYVDCISLSDRTCVYVNIAVGMILS